MAQPDDEAAIMLELEGTKKKKKKKIKKVELEKLLETTVQPDQATAAPKAEPQVTTTVKAAVATEESPAPAAMVDEFVLPKKKKRVRPNITFEGFSAVVLATEDEVEEGVVDEDEPSDNSPWAGTDRDYTYEELLDRVFEIMRQKNPSMVGGQKKKLVMKPPQVVRVGAKKTSFVNFTEICKLLHRQPKHLLAFLMSELGTSGSIDGTSQLIIKGKFQQKQIETVLRRYIKEYVTCHTCRSPETSLQKETRLFFLQCETCGSRCSVQSIKSGFQAITSNRKALRSKQQ